MPPDAPRISPPSPPPPPTEQAALRAAFHDELRTRNRNALLWSTTLFDAAYLGWTAFDRLLAPDHWREFLGIRVAVAAFGTAIALAVHFSRSQRHTWEAFWVWLFACGAGISLMLPRAGESVLQYIVGYSLILYGAGLLPFWTPLFALTNIVAILVTAPLAFLLMPSQVAHGDLVSGLFFVLTGGGASVAMASFKYGLAKRDFLTRAELASTSERLAEALRRVEASDRLKSRFFANISHELRTPLTLILAPVQAMLDGERDERAQRDLRTVEQNAERLVRLIDDLLDLSRLEAGGLRLRLSSVDLGEVVRGNVERCRPAAERRQVQLSVQVSPDLPAVVGDEHRLEMVVSNLLGNAIKYTEPGGRIEVSLSQGEGGVRVEVKDDGPGIADQDLARIFERFYRAEGAEDRRVGGVGIGLSLARELVELHGGTMDVRSQPGLGSTFGFTVPLGRDHIRPEFIERRGGVAERRTGTRDGATRGRRETDARAPLALPAGTAVDPTPRLDEAPLRLEQGRKPRVLLAEDQEELRRFIAELLEPNFEVIEAADGDAGWALVQSSRPDLVLSDVMMPGRSGASLCRAIKADPALQGVPVILLTARAGSEATLQAYADGADDFVAKPFHPRILVARIHAQLKLRALGAELAQRERLAAVGTLAAGILHEVRNPLNALLSATRTLTQGRAAPPTRDRLLAVVQDASQRIHDLTWTLDAHTRPAEAGGPALSDLQEGMEATLRLMDHRLAGVQVHRDFRGKGLAAVSTAPINQVFLNLVDNALKAGARSLWIDIEATPEQVSVRVADDGRGIPPDLLGRVFEPFFTTASPGEGSGLGLHLSRDIVERSGGTIQASHRQGGGAVFTLTLPGERAAGDPATAPASVSQRDETT